MKTCTLCAQKKSDDLFTRKRDGGRMPHCKVCHGVLVRQAFESRLRIQQRVREAVTPTGPAGSAEEEYRAYLEAGHPPHNLLEGNLMAKYGLHRWQVVEIRDRLLEERRGERRATCFLCGNSFVPKLDSPRVQVCKDCGDDGAPPLRASKRAQAVIALAVPKRRGRPPGSKNANSGQGRKRGRPAPAQAA